MPLLQPLPPQVCVLPRPMASDTITPQSRTRQRRNLSLQAVAASHSGDGGWDDSFPSPQLRGTPEHERASLQPDRGTYIHHEPETQNGLSIIISDEQRLRSRQEGAWCRIIQSLDW
jgi:hypothetical protein